MKAVLNTAAPLPWAGILGDQPWPLLPLGNRCWIEYWLEWCVSAGVRDVHLLLGDGAAGVEAYVGNGERWGLVVHYGFVRDGARPDDWLRRDPAVWRDGLLWLRRPVFPRRTAGFDPAARAPGSTQCLVADGELGVLCSDDPLAIQTWITTTQTPVQTTPFADFGLQPELLRSVGDYYQLNLALVDGEIERYVTPGYLSRDGTHVGYNVIYPPSASLAAPLMIGNDCRFSALCSIGPRVSIGNHVVVDRQAEIADSVILDGTYIGRNVEVKGRIVAGARLVDPADGTWVDVADAWLLADVAATVSYADAFRAVFGLFVALGMLLLYALPFTLLAGWLRLIRAGRWETIFWVDRFRQPVAVLRFTPCRMESFSGRLLRWLTLDRVPALWRVFTGRLWLCSERPVSAQATTPRPYYPGVFTYADGRRDFPDDLPLDCLDALYYAQHRSIGEDLAILARALFRHWFGGAPGRHPHPDGQT